MYIRILGNNDGTNQYVRRAQGFGPKQAIYVLVNDPANGPVFFSISSAGYNWDLGASHPISSSVGPFRVFQIRANPVTKQGGGGPIVPAVVTAATMTVTVTNTASGTPIATDTTPIQVVDEGMIRQFLATAGDEKKLAESFERVGTVTPYEAEEA